MFLLIDNFDSFTYNLVQIFQQSGIDPFVIRNNQKEIMDIAKDPQLKAVIISPGPGGPTDSGLCLSFLKRLPPEIPVLGVCLGHQILAHYAGYKIKKAARIMHGKTSQISHFRDKLYKNLKNPFLATRYHSLLMNEEIIQKPQLKVHINAYSEYREPMGLCYLDRPWMGIQFHPESILTTEGPKLLQNFVSITKNSNK